MSKRARYSYSKPKRAPFLLQKLISVIHAVGTTQDNTSLFTFTDPGTIKGLRWSIAVESVNTGLMAWAIVIVRDGNAANTLVITDGAEFYTPEQDVLAYGTVTTSSASNNKVIMGNTKTMRRCYAGDHLQFISIGDVATQANLLAVIRFYENTG